MSYAAAAMQDPLGRPFKHSPPDRESDKIAEFDSQIAG